MNWSLTQFNLIVYGNDEDPIFSNPSGRSSLPAVRLFEYTEPKLRDRYQDNLAGLGKLPALVVAELRPGQRTPAFLGHVDQVEIQGGEVHFQFQHLFDGLSSEEVFHCGHFDITIRPPHSNGIDERFRMHWAIKQGNLIEGLFRLLEDRFKDMRPRFFNVEDWPLPVLGHVAVMMPFTEEFNPVYEAIKAACLSQRIKACRVDDIHRPSQITDDVFSTIVQSSLVISDLTGRNPNVLYETGLAHALNRDVIMIVRDNDDVPFDLGHIRYIQYQPDSEGLEELKGKLSEFIRASDIGG